MPEAGSGSRWGQLVERIRDSAIASRLRTWTWAKTKAATGRAFHVFTEWAERLRKLTTSITLVGGVVLGIWIIADLSINEPLLFDDIHVHRDLAARVADGKHLSRRVSVHLDQFTAAVERLRDRKDSALKADTELPNLEIPGAEVSVQAVVQIVRQFLGRQERRIGGEIFLSSVSLAPQTSGHGTADGGPCPADRVRYVVVRLTTNRGELGEPVEAMICLQASDGGKPGEPRLESNTVEALMQLAAMRAYERINPCASAAYYFRNWYRRSLDGREIDPEFRRATMAIGTCLSASGHREAAYAHHMLGRIRQATGRSHEALRFFESAERLHRATHPRWRRWLDEQRVWLIRFDNDLMAHWGSALMDVQRTAMALEKFDEQIQRGTPSALGHIGKGNALIVLAGGDETKLKGAIAAYCRGYSQFRFDAEVRFELANILEKDRRLRGCSKKRTAGDMSYVIELRQKTVDLYPMERRYAFALMRSLREQSDFTGAVSTLNMVLHANRQDDWEAYSELADIYLRDGALHKVTMTYQRARDAYRRLAEQRPHDADARYHAALASLMLADDTEARERANEAIALDPRSAKARLALACAEWRRGDKAAARANLDAARMLDNGEDGLKTVDAVLQACAASIDHLANQGSQ
jgi:Flp pilus assembly protein TadD